MGYTALTPVGVVAGVVRKLITLTRRSGGITSGRRKLSTLLPTPGRLKRATGFSGMSRLYVKAAMSTSFSPRVTKVTPLIISPL
jgi:hypothetical protein